MLKCEQSKLYLNVEQVPLRFISSEYVTILLKITLLDKPPHWYRKYLNVFKKTTILYLAKRFIIWTV